MKPLFILSAVFTSTLITASFSNAGTEPDANLNQAQEAFKAEFPEHALPTEAQLRALMLSADVPSAAQDNATVSKSAVNGPLNFNQNDGRGRLKLDITPYPGVIVPHNFFTIQHPLNK